MRKFVYFFSFLLISGGCAHRISKKVGPLPPLTPTTIDVQEIDFEYMQGKAKLVYRDNTKEREVKANIRIRKDSVIWMKLHVLGIQGGAVLINKDSITIVSDLQKEYYVFDYTELSKRFNFKINYHSIQSALLGNLIIPKGTNDKIGEDSFFKKVIQKEDSITVQNLINKSTKKIERVDLNEPGTGNSVRINYSDFQPLGDKLFPYHGLIDVLYKTSAGIVNNTIVFEYSKADVGTKELRFHFKIPKRYDRR
ncbi:MAG: DUF4292 domain-containing protein [Bacteroidetes bacterium]|nr:DUF4292 domain-containing protein [Bacteroidota bacterium]MBI3481637.1 DUF4292 domain-containing protein [Bacteroidota bacterium]